jgi:hypothetical protein
MQNRKWMAAGATAPALVAFLLSGISAADSTDDAAVARKEIQKAEVMRVQLTIEEEVGMMASAVGRGRKIDKDAAAFFKEHPDELKKTMWVFKPRMEKGEGGFGVGPVPGKYTPDGIEIYIAVKSNPMRGKVTAAELKNGADDFNRMADVTIAMAEITHQFIPKKAPPGAVLKNWTRYADEMKTGAEDLKAAVKAQKPDDAKKAFQNIYSACASCHSEFRE